MKSEEKLKIIVFKKRSLMREKTSSVWIKEIPKSPLKALESQESYCFNKGSYKPKLFSRRSFASKVVVFVPFAYAMLPLLK